MRLRWGCVPDPTGGAYSAPTNPLAGFHGAALRDCSEDSKREGRGGKGRGGEGKGTVHVT